MKNSLIYISISIALSVSLSFYLKYKLDFYHIKTFPEVILMDKKYPETQIIYSFRNANDSQITLIKKQDKILFYKDTYYIKNNPPALIDVTYKDQNSSLTIVEDLNSEQIVTTKNYLRILLLPKTYNLLISKQRSEVAPV
jgi:hypothetical protein